LLPPSATKQSTEFTNAMPDVTITKRIRGRNHGYAVKKSPAYYSWKNMVERCTNARHKDFKHYGARGIVVAERWRDFRNFIVDMGDRPPGTSLGRIDNNGNYEPGNCRWETRFQQSRNTRRSRIFTVFGVTGCLKDLSASVGVNPWTVSRRLKKGWPVELAFSKIK
jgi:hypothetical protein